MKIVKVSFNYDWPLFRQSPQGLGEWGDYKFVLDDTLKECDFWIVYTSYKFVTETVTCHPDNIIFMPGECYNTSPRFSQKFLNQFGALVTVQRELKHKNIRYAHNANPWFVDKNYDELLALETPKKIKLISVVSSNKAFTEGHKSRLDFVAKLKNHFGDQLDVFGRGIKDFDDKWEVLADYKYSIAIENDNCDDWVTEKFFDCLLAHTLPFYYGCPNLESIVDKNAFIRIDSDNFEESVKIIEDSIRNNEFEKRLEHIKKEAVASLNKHNFFPFVVDILDTMDATKAKRAVTVKAESDLNKIRRMLSKIKQKVVKRKR